MHQSPSCGRVSMFNSVVLWLWYLLIYNVLDDVIKLLCSLLCLFCIVFWYITLVTSTYVWKMDPSPHMLCIRFCPENRVWQIRHRRVLGNRPRCIAVSCGRYAWPTRAKRTTRGNTIPRWISSTVVDLPSSWAAIFVALNVGKTIPTRFVVFPSSRSTIQNMGQVSKHRDRRQRRVQRWVCQRRHCQVASGEGKELWVVNCLICGSN
jgi:hypothetical protein